MKKAHTNLTRPRPPRAARIVALRRQAGLGQVEAATEFEITRGHYANIETGADNPGRDLLVRMAAFYNVTIDYLETGAGGHGVQFTADAEEDRERAELIHNWTLLNDVQRDTIARVIRSYLVGDNAPTHHDTSQNDREKTLSQ